MTSRDATSFLSYTNSRWTPLRSYVARYLRIRGQLASIFSDAFHHLPIHRNFRHFLAFQVGRRRFQYCACPFGLSPIPQVFTELYLPVKVFAPQAWQCTVFQYIDDWLFITPSQRRTTEVTHLFIRLCGAVSYLPGLTGSVRNQKPHTKPQSICIKSQSVYD